ncbi:MAG: extracellular solute-binding protein [Treponema sp.]|jgi:putative aldouronate transport system substrate-binding protein|nr:extracellular solute-binding protein [Treponema sp.]
MKDSAKRLILGAGVFLLAAAAVFAGGGSQSSGAAGSASANAQYPKHLELTMAVWGIEDAFNKPGAANDTIFNELISKFNVTITPIQITWGDYMEKARLWAAAGQLPDMFSTDLPMAELTTWASQGVVKALPDDLSRWPTIQATMNDPAAKATAINGKFYKYPRMAKQSSSDWIIDRALAYRKDWLKEAGYDHEPRTFDEFVEVTKKVLAKHPDAIGLDTSVTGLFALMSGVYPPVSNTGNWVKQNGQWIPAWAAEGALPGIVQARRLYTEGILSPDFATGAGTVSEVGMFMSGKAFAHMSVGPLNFDKIEVLMATVSPGAKVEDTIAVMDVWAAPDGVKYYFAETPFWAETLFRGNLDQEKFERSLYLLDYMSTNEFQIRRWNGIEGVDWKMENGQMVSLLPADTTVAQKYPIVTGMGNMGAYGEWLPFTGGMVISSNPALAAANKIKVDYFNHRKEIGTPIDINFNIYLMPKIGGRFDIGNDLTRVLVGRDDPVAMWRAVLREYQAQGYDEMVQDVNTKARAMGL